MRPYVLLLALLGCAGCIRGSAQLNQDAMLRWMTSAANEDAKILYRQNYAMAQDDAESAPYSKTLALGFEASDGACAGVDTDKIPNDLAVWHNALSGTGETPKLENIWAETPSDADSFEMSLIDRSGSGGLQFKPPAEVPLNVGAKFGASATALTLARITKRVDLSDTGRKCVVATLCRPTAGKDTPPTTVTFVERIYYGNLIRLKFSKQAFELAGEATVEGVTAKFAVNASNVNLDAAILGRLKNSTKACTFDIPEILKLVAEKKLSAVQNLIAECAVNHEIIAVRFAKVPCSSS